MNEHDVTTGARKIKVEGNVATDIAAIKTAIQGIQAIMEEEKTIDGNITVSGTATVEGATVLESTLAVSGDIRHSGNKAGFQGATPIEKPAAYTQTYATASRTVASCATSFSAIASTSEYLASVTDLNTVAIDLENLKKNVNSIIDDLQSYGLFQ
ncbi:MAG TPA: hypothetical protein PLQ61_06865 [Bacteroidales bacterium]|nr:hypothetical protein [Petrotogaceae bacterium]HQJ20898.1 hypothetical protein [Bacteroidales bacterium]